MDGAQALGQEAESQFILGRLYESSGSAAKIARTKAAICYFNAAHMGHAQAQLCLAFCYEIGDGIERDLGKALHWAAVAAGQGHAGAQLLLGRLYRDGTGVVTDKKWSRTWYLRALEHRVLGHDVQERFELDAGAEVVDEDWRGVLYVLDKSEPRLLALRVRADRQSDQSPLDSFYFIHPYLNTVFLAWSNVTCPGDR